MYGLAVLTVFQWLANPVFKMLMESKYLRIFLTNAFPVFVPGLCCSSFARAPSKVLPFFRLFFLSVIDLCFFLSLPTLTHILFFLWVEHGSFHTTQLPYCHRVTLFLLFAPMNTWHLMHGAASQVLGNKCKCSSEVKAKWVSNGINR